MNFNGTFDAAGTSASGRFQVHVPFDQDGVHYAVRLGRSGLVGQVARLI